jgi:hypothetical protein
LPCRIDGYGRNVADEKLAAGRPDDFQARLGGQLTSGMEHVDDSQAEDGPAFVQLPGLCQQLLADDLTGRPCRRWQQPYRW